MAKSTLFRFALLILCLGAASVPAQEPGMILPLLLDVYEEPPFAPETLPPPALRGGASLNKYAFKKSGFSRAIPLQPIR